MKALQKTLNLLSFHVVYVPHGHRTPTAVCAVFAELGERSSFPVNIYPENRVIPLKAFACLVVCKDLFPQAQSFCFLHFS